MHPALFYSPGERLSLPELGAARLDGHVIEVGEGYMPADTVEGTEARVTSIAGLVPPRTAACGPTAAWIHGAGDRPPAVHHVRRVGPTRIRMASTRRVVYHDRTAADHDVQTVAGVAVLVPVAAAFELLFETALAPGGAAGDSERWLRALLLVRPELLADLRAGLEGMPRRPGRRAAVRLVDDLAATVPDATAVRTS